MKTSLECCHIRNIHIVNVFCIWIFPDSLTTHSIQSTLGDKILWHHKQSWDFNLTRGSIFQKTHRILTLFFHFAEDHVVTSLFHRMSWVEIQSKAWLMENMFGKRKRFFFYQNARLIKMWQVHWTDKQSLAVDVYYDWNCNLQW